MNVVLTHYHIQCEPYLGIGWCEIIRIPCAFIDCSNFVDLPWDPSLLSKDQTIYSSVTKFKYYSILGKHNYSEIMEFCWQRYRLRVIWIHSKN